MNNSKVTLERRKELRKYYKKTIDPNSFPVYIKKICKDCWKEKDCKWNSSFTTKWVPEYKARCDKCHNIFKRIIAKSSVSKWLCNIRVKKYQRQNKQWAVDYLWWRCIKCWYNKCLRALNFHHRNPEKKQYTIWEILDHHKNKLKKELNKCDLLCSNCHMEEHNK